jgi:AcrR family transcriptional regulator
VTEAETIAADLKRARILDGAMKVFLAYGFSRTTMDDIARAAEMSRPALYLAFRNKTEIYRALAAAVLEKSAAGARTTLSGDGPFAERLMAAIETCLIGMLRAIKESPHGAEILDMKNTLAADLHAGWRSRLAAAFAAAIEAEAEARGMKLANRGLSPELLADLLLDGLEGMKMRITDPDEQRRVAHGLVRVLETVLQA